MNQEDKMGYGEFKDQLILYFQEKLGEDVHVDIRRILKVNTVAMDGLSILYPGENVSPTIYLREYYELYLKKLSFEETALMIERAYNEGRCVRHVDVQFFKCFEEVKERIVFKLVNYNRNQELLKEVPHRRFLDFAILYYCMVTDEVIGNGSITVNNSHMKAWESTEQELFELAERNTPKLLPCMLTEMRQMIDELTQEESISETVYGEESIDRCLEMNEDEDQQVRMYVLTNKSKIFGAITMLYPDILQCFSEKLGSDLYILPSSIHEVILIPKTYKGEKSFLKNMVNEVNEEQVPEEEILSYQVYEYNRENDCIVLEDMEEAVLA